MEKRILAVEDDQDILDIYEYIFMEAGYEISTLSTGAGLFQKIDVFRPSLILMDVNLGEFRGTDLCRKLKDNPNYQHIVVLLVSAERHLTTLAYGSGADGILAKPFDIEVLLQQADRYLD